MERDWESFNEPHWFTACASSGCAEVRAVGQIIQVRSSLRPWGVAELDHAEWAQFLTDVKAGRYDHIAAEAATG